MRRELSSRITPVFRWIIPGLLTVAAVVVIWRFGGLGTPGSTEPASVIVAVLIAVLLFVLARVFDRAKRVWIEEQILIVSDYRTEVRVDLQDIENVEVTRFITPDRVRVRFSRPTQFGDSIVFFPPGRWFKLSSSNPVATELEKLAADAKASGQDE